ncbi:MAG: hypothetical protein ACXWJW_13830 [Xanthobacteraceae bacterium]
MFDIVKRGDEPYRFENGALFKPQPAPPPSMPDRNFDGDSIYGLSDWTTPETEASEHPTSLAPSDSD